MTILADSQRILAEAWRALSDDDAPCGLEITGEAGHLPSRLPVEAVGVASVGAALLAAAAFHRQRSDTIPPVALDIGHVAAAVRSERFFRVDDEPAGMGFAPLSRFWPAADGWVRTHANYPWHRDGLLRALGIDDASPEVIAAAINAMPAADVEGQIVSSGGIAGAVRTLDEWRTHPQGEAVAAEPLVAHESRGDAPARRREPTALPASGIRILDLTRVIAGPVCTRFLSALGADVLRVDPPSHPDMAPGVAADTLLGKRSATIDLRPDRDALSGVLEQADVVVRGYRPGALDALGLSEDELVDRYPGLVVVSLAAWGHTGPWADRRGFDSIVQGVAGIGRIEAVDDAPDVEPGALPCQLLDHATGYLAAAAVLDGLRRQAEHGGTHLRRVSLARTAAWLCAQPRDELDTGTTPGGDDGAWLTDISTALGTLTAVTPPGSFDGRPLQWTYPSVGYGRDSLAFSS